MKYGTKLAAEYLQKLVLDPTFIQGIEDLDIFNVDHTEFLKLIAQFLSDQQLTSIEDIYQATLKVLYNCNPSLVGRENLDIENYIEIFAEKFNNNTRFEEIMDILTLNLIKKLSSMYPDQKIIKCILQKIRN